MPAHSTLTFTPDTWLRAGRGRSFQFYATDEEVLQVLRTCLPEALGPYSLIGSYVVTSGHRPVHHFISATPDEFLTVRANGVWQFFLRSWQLTPRLDLPADETLNACLSLHGMVNIQQGRILKGHWQYSNIGMANRVQHTVTHQLVVHQSYERLFTTLKRAIDKILYFATEHIMADGSVQESRHLRMSRHFAELCSSGEILAKDRVGCKVVKNASRR